MLGADVDIEDIEVVRGAGRSAGQGARVATEEICTLVLWDRGVVPPWTRWRLVGPDRENVEAL
jgi:hypothetical protein